VGVIAVVALDKVVWDARMAGGCCMNKPGVNAGADIDVMRDVQLRLHC
jgi:hypothetical protein